VRKSLRDIVNGYDGTYQTWACLYRLKDYEKKHSFSWK